jgi:hypothetical protein
LDFDEGFFVEAGANDGITQSNTYYFEKMRNWRGLLVEPIPELAASCRRNRRSPVIEAALVGPDFAATEIQMQFAGLMSVSEGAFGDAEQRQRHLEIGLTQDRAGRTYVVRVPALTLSTLIASHAAGREIDLLSLTALSGLDLTRHAPRFVCVEAREPLAVGALLDARYEQLAVLSDNGTHQDLLFRRR